MSPKFKLNIDTCPRVFLLDGTEARYFPAEHREPGRPWVVLNGNCSDRYAFPSRVWDHKPLDKMDYERMANAINLYEAATYTPLSIWNRIMQWVRP